jgi:mannose/cellobiose epimerase-like protein (N-acyl-D-glucosamine 2-epimerase family)
MCCPLSAVFVVLSLLFAAPRAGATQSSALEDSARQWRTELSAKIMPYWLRTMDEQQGGYLLADDAKATRRPTEKQLVSQTRMIWTFSRVHHRGLSDTHHNYLNAATHGYRFLCRSLFDSQHGGYFWKTDLAGQPLNDCKFLYGQSFVVYALVEYYRASGEREALQRAVDLYHAIQRHLHDPKNGGWFEHTERNWVPLRPGDQRNEVEVIGYKSANAHLHWMEALTELYDVTRNPDVKKSLQEALRLNMKFFYPKDAADSAFHRQPNWKPVTDAASAGLSYGHNVEFAWLMVHAEQVLKRKPSWNHFYAHLDHALKYGYDHRLGGLYNRGLDNQPATDTAKIWWVQAEMLAALTDALAHRPNPTYETALAQLVHFIRTYQADPRDGIWLDTVSPDGQPVRTGKAHGWKANYHDVRAILKFIDTFDP